ncbi:zinc-binding loop-containing protein [Chlorella virus XW01]|nr:zinc-binding loop-containing protein [Chlorella virus XW01]
MLSLEILNNIARVEFESLIVSLDAEDLKYLLISSLSNSSHNPPKWLLNDNNILYTLDKNFNKKYLHDLIYGYKIDKIKFIDGDYYNYSKQNLQIVDNNSIILDGKSYNVIELIKGHFKTSGKSAYKLRNNIYKINYEGEERYYMFCEVDTYTRISKQNIEKIKKFNKEIPTWYLLKNGYIGAHLTVNDKDTIIYLHQHLMDHYGNGLSQGNLTVDHINQDKLDNRNENLRLITQTEQNLNQGKRKRQSTAKHKLPDFIKELPKYVQYNGCRFEIINHPKSPNRNFYSTHKMDVPMEERYKQILEILKQVENGDYLNAPKETENSKTTEYGKHIYKTKVRDNDCFVFECFINKKRYNMKSSSLGIYDFKERIMNKYPELNEYLKSIWDNNKPDNNQLDNNQLDNNQLDNNQLDNNQLDNNQLDNNQLDNNLLDNTLYGKYIRLGSLHDKPALIFEYRDIDKDLRLTTSSIELDINKFKQKVIEKFPIISDLLKIVWNINNQRLELYNYKNYILPVKFSLYTERGKYLILAYDDRQLGHNKKLNLNIENIPKDKQKSYLDEKMNELKIGLMEKYPDYNFGWNVNEIEKPVLNYKLPDDRIKVITVKGQKLLKIDIKKENNRIYRTMVFNDKQEEVDNFYQKNKIFLKTVL